MLIQADVSVEPGDSFELWARRRLSATPAPSPALTIFSGDRIVYRIATLLNGAEPDLPVPVMKYRPVCSRPRLPCLDY